MRETRDTEMRQERHREETRNVAEGYRGLWPLGELRSHAGVAREHETGM